MKSFNCRSLSVELVQLCCTGESLLQFAMKCCSACRVCSRVLLSKGDSGVAGTWGKGGDGGFILQLPCSTTVIFWSCSCWYTSLIFSSGSLDFFRNVINMNFSIIRCVCFTLSSIVDRLEVIYRLREVWVLQDENHVAWGFETAVTSVTEWHAAEWLCWPSVCRGFFFFFFSHSSGIHSIQSCF